MNKTFWQSNKISIGYDINNFIYNLKRFPIIKHFIKDSAYKNKDLKQVLRILVIIFKVLKSAAFRVIYYLFLYFFTMVVTDGNASTESLLTIFVALSLFGMFINNKLLDPKKENYFMIVLFNLDATYYMKILLYKEIFKDVFLDFIILTQAGRLIGLNIFLILEVILFKVMIRIVGEAYEMIWYKKYGEENRKVKMVINISAFLGSACICVLSFLRININSILFSMFLAISVVLGILAYRYLIHIKDYKALFKKINTMQSAMLEEIQTIDVKMNKKDIEVNKSAVLGKHGYDLFNTIFMERHKNILYRSSRNISLILFAIYVITVLVMIFYPDVKVKVNEYILGAYSFFPLLIYYLNRGQVVTMAMYYNSDHAMLTYNFFRKSNVILGLFKKRMISLIKINLIPAFVMGIGNTFVIIFSGGTDLMTYISSFAFIISLSIFFSIHYLVLYYLFQPFTASSRSQKYTYSVAIMITYMVCYMLSQYQFNTFIFSIAGICFTIIYMVISYILITKFAPKTFKNN